MMYEQNNIKKDLETIKKNQRWILGRRQSVKHQETVSPPRQYTCRILLFGTPESIESLQFPRGDLDEKLHLMLVNFNS